MNRDLFRIDRSYYIRPCHFSLVLPAFYGKMMVTATAAKLWLRMSDNAYGGQKKFPANVSKIGLTFDSQGKFQAILLTVLQCSTSMLETRSKCRSLDFLLYRTQFLKELFTSYDLHFLSGFLESLLGLCFHVQRIFLLSQAIFRSSLFLWQRYACLCSHSQLSLKKTFMSPCHPCKRNSRQRLLDKPSNCQWFTRGNAFLLTCLKLLTSSELKAAAIPLKQLNIIWNTYIQKMAF